MDTKYNVWAWTVRGTLVNTNELDNFGMTENPLNKGTYSVVSFKGDDMYTFKDGMTKEEARKIIIALAGGFTWDLSSFGIEHVLLNGYGE